MAEAERLEMKDKAVLVLAELLLTAEIIKDLKEHRALFLSVSLYISFTISWSRFLYFAMICWAVLV